MRLSIRWKLLLSISLPLLVVFSIMLFWDYQRVREGAIEQVQGFVLERAQNSANGINNRLDAVSQSAENLSTMLGRAMDAGDLRSRLGFNMRPNPFTAATHVIYDAADGTPTLATQQGGGPGERRPNTQPLANEPIFANLYALIHADKKARWSGVHPGNAGRQMVCTYIEPILQAQKLVGAVLVDINVNDLLRNRNRRGGRNEPTSQPQTEARTGATQPTGAEIGDAFAQLAERGQRDSGRFTAAATQPSDFPDRGGPPENETFGQRRGGGFGERGFDRRENRRSTAQSGENFPGEDRGPGFGGPPPELAAEEATATTGTSLDPDSNAIEVIDRDGKPVLMRSSGGPATRPASVLQWADEHNLPEFTKAFRAALDGSSGIARVPDLGDIAPNFIKGQTYWIAMAPIKETGWVYLAAIPESQVIGPLMQRLQQRALFLIAGLVVILIVATVVAFRLSRPIVDMAVAVRELAAGNLDARVTSVKSQDEFGQLARAFNSMTGQLKAYVHALTEQTKVREKSESELRIARQIQTDLLPRTFPPFPDRPEFDLHAVNIPAAGVAGDFYDFFFVADDWLTICIADVSGKGVPAALLMAVTRTIVRNLALAGLPLQQICERANEMLLSDTSNNMFVTMFLAQYHPKTGKLKYVNAGHPRPFIFSSGSEVKLFGEVTSPLLGVCEVCEIGPVESAEAQIEIGQTLLLYTDGVTEARATDGSMLRDPGAMKLVHEHDAEDVATFCDSMVAAIDAYQDHRPADDITILALRRKM